MANKDNTFILSSKSAAGAGSPFSFLTSGDGAGKLKYAFGGSIVSAADVDGGGVSGLVIPLHGATIASFPDHENANSPLSHTAKNIMGDPAVGEYALTSGDFMTDAGVEKNGGAQKFVNAVLDAAFRGYTSGVAQGSGLNSMTVTRGALSLGSTAVNDGTGIVNTYTRSYTVNFKYYQSGTINTSGSLDPAVTDVANDNSGGVPF
tara:strand:- start:58 stop:672 length:615 start_codon:yes stop_codon:yes gene_type:complete